jgi:hypothetical protein
LEPFKGKFPILGLGTMFGSDYMDTGGEMFEANSGLRFVLSLATRPPRPKGLNNYLLFEDFRIGIVFLLRGSSHELKCQMPKECQSSKLINNPPSPPFSKGGLGGFEI